MEKDEEKLANEIRENYTDLQILEAINHLNQLDGRFCEVDEILEGWKYDDLDELRGKLGELNSISKAKEEIISLLYKFKEDWTTDDFNEFNDLLRTFEFE